MRDTRLANLIEAANSITMSIAEWSESAPVAKQYRTPTIVVTLDVALFPSLARTTRYSKENELKNYAIAKHYSALRDSVMVNMDDPELVAKAIAYLNDKDTK